MVPELGNEAVVGRILGVLVQQSMEIRRNLEGAEAEPK